MQNITTNEVLRKKWNAKGGPQLRQATLSQKLKAKLIFNVSDLWPESAEKLGIVTNKYLLGLAYRLERKCYEKSFLITGQTMGIVEDIKSRFPHKKVYWLPNGVDVEFYNPAKYQGIGFRERNGYDSDDIISELKICSMKLLNTLRIICSALI